MVCPVYNHVNTWLVVLVWKQSKMLIQEEQIALVHTSQWFCKSIILTVALARVLCCFGKALLHASEVFVNG